MQGDLAKKSLAAIRFVNGAAALLAPNFLGRRLGVTTPTSPGFGYALRLFGVRTVLLGIQLWRAPDDPADPVVRQAVLIHAIDTASALTVQRRHELPPAGARMAIAASALNTVLAVVMNVRLRRTR